MEVGMSLNSLVMRLPVLPNRRTTRGDSAFVKHSLGKTKEVFHQQVRKGKMTVVEAKGRRGMAGKQFQRAQPPPLPKLEDDGNPKFVLFIRMANFNIWYPLNIVTGGTTAKIMVAAKDNFLGKYIYKDTLARNLAAIIYKDEKEVQRMAIKQFRILRSATEFQYGYKIVENNNLKSALVGSDVIELPSKGELKTVVDKVMDFFGDAKESFGKMTFLNAGTESPGEEAVVDSKEKSKVERNV